MSHVEEPIVAGDIAATLDQLAVDAAVQSNTMFQLALMVARIAVAPCQEAYKEEAAQALMGVIRAKPKSNVVRLFGNRPCVQALPAAERAAGQGHRPDGRRGGSGQP